MNDVINAKQHENESVLAHHKRFVNLVKVIESKWGLIMPTKMAEDNPNCGMKTNEVKKETRDEFLACVFLCGVNRKNFEKFLGDLNNAFLTRKNNCPIMMEAALHCVQHQENNDVSGEQQRKNWNEVSNHVAFAECVAGTDGKRFPRIEGFKCECVSDLNLDRLSVP